MILTHEVRKSYIHRGVPLILENYIRYAFMTKAIHMSTFQILASIIVLNGETVSKWNMRVNEISKLSSILNRISGVKRKAKLFKLVILIFSSSPYTHAILKIHTVKPSGGKSKNHVYYWSYRVVLLEWMDTCQPIRNVRKFYGFSPI